MDNSDRIEIPNQLLNSNTGGHMERCIECDCFLLDEGTEYFLEKAFKKYEGYTATDVIFEYALCIQCANTMKGELSLESITNLENYLKENINPEYMQTDELGNPMYCVIKGTPIDQLTEFQIMAHCTGQSLNLKFPMPLLISGAVAEDMNEVLSKATKDSLDDFVDRNFGLPPEFKDLPISSRPILI